jgi:hypothetical protein
MCNCKKQPVVTTPTISEPVLDELNRTDYPDTIDGQLAYDLKIYNDIQQNKIKQDDIDYFNNIDDYPLIED